MPPRLWSFLARSAFQIPQVSEISEKIWSRESSVSREGMYPQVLRELANVHETTMIFERS